MSISSFEGSPLPADLAAKYEKLATEYAKVRAQVGVLKKAVVEEQGKSSELREELKLKDQLLRKNEQEFDSLSFRNLQLTKRISVLQGELDHLQAMGRKSRVTKTESGSIQDNIVMQEEFEKTLNANMKLVSTLDETRAAFESERQLWQDEVAACKQMVRNSQKLESECECEKLRRALTAAESELEFSKRQNLMPVVKKRTGSQRVRTVLHDLPIKDLLTGIFHLTKNCTKLSSSPPAVKEFNDDMFGSGDSPSQILQCLVSYHSSLEAVTSNIHESSVKTMLQKISSLLEDLRREFASCLNTNLETSKAEEAFSSLSEVARSFRSSSQFHLGILKEVWEDRTSQSPYDLILSALSNILTSSTALWKYTSDSIQTIHSAEENETLDSTIDIVRRGACEDCERISLNYDKKISALEEKIKHMTATTESLPILSKNNGFKSENCIGFTEEETEFGHGSVPVEVSWPDATVRDLILKKTSEAIEDRQAAESKLTRLMIERDAAYSRMLAFEEQSTEQSSIIATLQDELRITKCSYEDQLSSMTEHVANMNDKLAAQETQIEELTYEMVTKDNKKGRHK